LGIHGQAEIIGLAISLAKTHTVRPLVCYVASDAAHVHAQGRRLLVIVLPISPTPFVFVWTVSGGQTNCSVATLDSID
jgi:hypothetical protein